MLIKVGLRNNLLYPCLFLLSLFLRKIFNSIFELLIYNFIKIEIKYINSVAIYLIQLIMGLSIIIYRNIKKNKPKNEKKNEGVKLIQNKELKLKKHDSNNKIYILLFFAAYFEKTGALTRRYFTKNIKEDRTEEYHAKFRSIEIILASILCYFTFHISILKHQFLSLLIIIICFIIVLIFDIFREDDLLKNIGNIIISSICRVFLDTIEKYLIDYDYIDVYEMMGYEATFNCILTSILYISDKPRKEIKNIFEVSISCFFLIIAYLFLNSLFTLFKNIYRRLTIKVYYPMTRALAESVLDPIFIIYDKCNGNYKSTFSFIVTLSCSIITILISCIYNEVFILYCCGLEYETHYEIALRSKSIELNNSNDVSERTSNEVDDKNN